MRKLIILHQHHYMFQMLVYLISIINIYDIIFKPLDSLRFKYLIKKIITIL